MITVTPTACAILADLLAESAIASHLALRVVADEQDHLDLSLESPQPEDQVIRHRGRNVLALEARAAEKLDGRTLDIQATDRGPQLAP